MNKKQVREFLFNKTNGKCGYCGCKLPDRWHIDHIIPIKRDMPKDIKRISNNKLYTYEYLESLDNKMASCPECNINKHSMDLETFRNTILYYVTSLNKYTVTYKMAKKYNLIVERFKEIEFYFEKKNNIKESLPCHICGTIKDHEDIERLLINSVIYTVCYKCNNSFFAKVRTWFVNT